MLEGKVAAVTGAGKGVGRAIALALAAEGAKVVVNDLGVQVDGSAPSAGPADEVAAAIREAGGEAVASYDDISTMAGGRHVTEIALDLFGRIDAVFAVAGILRPAIIDEMTEEEWDTVINVNLKGTFATVQPAAKAMRAQKSGTIVTFTSVGGLEGSPNQPNYSATKEGIIGFTRSIALSLAPHVTCNVISPSAKTRMIDRMRAGFDPGRPEQVAPTAVFLASDTARGITGQVIAVGANRIALYPQPKAIRTAYRDGSDWTPQGVSEIWDSTLGTERLLRWDRFVKE
jgi:NAD(P)-dependent dehydrogenase (short-subunit alcohol dehydrogenase family)